MWWAVSRYSGRRTENSRSSSASVAREARGLVEGSRRMRSKRMGQGRSRKKQRDPLRRISRFGGRITTPPPVAMTKGSLEARAFSRSLDSRSRKKGSPRREKIPGISSPASFSIAPSRSRRGIRDLRATSAPTADFPHPMKPIREMLCRGWGGKWAGCTLIPRK